MDTTPEFVTQDALVSSGVTARTLTDHERRALDERGYLVLSNAVAAKELKRLRIAFDQACEREGVAPRGTRHPKTLLDSEPGFNAFLMHPRLLAAVMHILAKPFRTGISGRDPLPGFGQQGLHIDAAGPALATQFYVVTAIGLLDDFTSDNGATRVVPGSHLWHSGPSKSFADPGSRHPEQVVITAPAGSILVFNGHLWHGGTGNHSGDHRRALQCSFAAQDTRLPMQAQNA